MPVNRNITVKPRNRRRDRRRHLDLVAKIDGRDISLIDISVNGFGAAIDATQTTLPDLPLGHRGRLDIWLDDGRHMRIDVEIKRELTRDGIFGGNFVDLSDHHFRLIEALLLGREHRVGR